ncbi:hypothetical protein [Kitasatospora sp. NPDC047058]|uniref:hypothetical protein n=1 Tax=Kitasatospora sp. NPDC047058 TaxID=3155620 RepID=UPI0033D21732
MTAELTFPSITDDPQDRATRLLLTLVADPALPRLPWTITEDGSLTAHLRGHDLCPAVAAYARRLGAAFMKQTPFTYDGHRLVAEEITTILNGVPVTVWFTSDLAAYPDLLDQQERQLACRFICEHDDPDGHWCDETRQAYANALSTLRLEAAA